MGNKTRLTLENNELLRWRSHSKSSRIRRLQCENGLFLEVLCDGSIRGSKDGEGEYGVFHLYSVGPNLVAIRNIITGLFISVDNFLVTTKEHFTEDCIFEERLSCRFDVSYISRRDNNNEGYFILCINEIGELSIADESIEKIHAPLMGKHFKTLMLPEDEFLHFFCMGRSLEW